MTPRAALSLGSASGAAAAPRAFAAPLPSDFLRRAARLHPRKAAVLLPSGESTVYAAIHERANRLANALVQGLGLAPGERLAILLENGPAYWEVYFAAARAGVVAVPINTHLTPAEMTYIVQDAGVSALIHDGAMATQTSALLEQVRGGSLRAVIAHGSSTAGGSGSASWSYEELLSRASSQPPSVPVLPETPLLQIYTSGTTGQPKGVVLSHRAMVGNAQAQALAHYLRHDDVFLTATPLYHLAAAARVFAVCLVGASQYVVPKFEPAQLLALVEEQGVTSTLLVATMAREVLDALEQREYDLRALRSVCHGAAPTPIEVLQAAVERLPAEHYVGWGLTEGGVFLTALRPDEYLTVRGGEPRRLASAGREVAGAEVNVLNPDGQIPAPGEPGEMVVRSDRLMTGYWNRPDETADVLRDLEIEGQPAATWLLTGDVAYADEDGFLYIVDRKKEMIVSGGVNVYPSEIEQVLTSHPSVREAAVVGVPNERWGEVPRAFVVLEPDAPLTADSALAYCREHLARFKVPAAVEFVDTLPRTSVGKIAKAELAAPYWRGYTKRVN